jgi:hypothetical protein
MKWLIGQKQICPGCDHAVGSSVNLLNEHSLKFLLPGSEYETDRTDDGGVPASGVKLRRRLEF